MNSAALPAEGLSESKDELCLYGKVDTPDQVIDFVTSTQFTASVGEAGDGPLLLLPFVSLETIKPDGSFEIKVPLSGEGTYHIRVDALSYNVPDKAGEEGKGSIDYSPSSKTLIVYKIAAPDFKPTEISYSGGSGDGIKSIVGGNEYDMDGDGICDGPAPVSDVSGKQICTAGPDTKVNYNVGSDSPYSGKRTKICVLPVNPKDKNAAIELHAVNAITDSDFNPSRLITLKDENSETTLKGSTPDFCQGGFVLSVPTAHGLNHIEATMKNKKGSQSFSVDLQVDLKGPDFCPAYFGGANLVASTTQETPVILASELDGALTVKVAAKGCGSDKPVEDLFVSEACPEGLCATVNGKAVTQVKGQGGGTYQFAVDSKSLHFPLNFISLTGKDSLGNETSKTVSLGYGEVRHPFNSSGLFSAMKGVVPDAVGGFIPEEYLNGQLKTDIEHFMDSAEFKVNLLPKLFKIEKPSTKEADACGGDEPWEGSRIFEDTGLVTFLHVPKKGEPDFDQAMAEIKKMKVTVPYLQLLNQDTLLVQLSIQDLVRRAEIFTVRFDKYEEDRPENVDELPGNIIGPDDPQFGDVVNENTFGLKVLPIKFTIEDLDLYLKIHFYKDGDGNMQMEVSVPPNAPDGKLLNGMGKKGRLVTFDCGKAGDQSLVHNTNGKQLYKETEACNSVESLNEYVNQNGFEPNAFNQNIDARFKTILAATVSCNLPFKVARQLQKFNTEAVAQTAIELGDQRLILDFFAPLAQADLSTKTWGLYFKGGGFIMPAGFEETTQPDKCDEEDKDLEYGERKCKASKFVQQALPESLRKDHRFGSIYDSEDGAVEPGYEAEGMAANLNLALKEDLINSIVFGSTLLMDSVIKSQGESSKMLDLDQKMLIEDLQMGINVVGSECETAKKNNDNKFDDWKCFPKPLRLDSSFASIATTDPLASMILPQGVKIPLLMRTHLNPYFPPTVRLVDSSVNTKDSQMYLILEINLGSSLMEVFEEKLASSDDPNNQLGTGTGEIKDWCDDDRANSSTIKMDPKKCSEGHIMPIMSFLGTGKITVKLSMTIKNDMLILAGGLASKIAIGDDGKPDVKLDEEKTFMRFTTVENNTLSNVSSDMDGTMKIVLGQFISGTDHEIRMRIPLTAPVLKGENSFCATHPKVNEICDCAKPENKDNLECKLVDVVDDLIDDLDIKKYGFEGGSVEELFLGMTEQEFGAPRLLMIGLTPELTYGDASDYETIESPLTEAVPATDYQWKQDVPVPDSKYKKPGWWFK